MLNRGFALAALVLPLYAFSASTGHAQDAQGDAGGSNPLMQLLSALAQGGQGGDAATAAVDDGGVQQPVVYENGEWGYHDHNGRWRRAPEAHQRYMEYHHPHGVGFRPGERGYARPGQMAMRPGMNGRPMGMRQDGFGRPTQMAMQHPVMGGRPGITQVHAVAPMHAAPAAAGGRKH